jgi:hypothetical protein
MSERADQQGFVYRHDGQDPLGPPQPGMEVCAKVYLGHGGHDHAVLAVVGDTPEAVAEAFLAGAAGLHKIGDVPADVATCLKVATDWAIDRLNGLTPLAASVQ